MMPESIGMAVLIALFLLLLLRVPIGLAMILCALVGNAVFQGVTPALVQLQLVLWEMTSDFVLLTLPLFIWMGLLAKQAGLGDDLASCVRCWMGRLPGGLAATSALSSAGFGTLTGSSVATVLTMGGMMLPEMKRYGYQPAFAAGSIAAGGVLAILIPPSLPLIFYGAWTETSIAALFLAGIIPGLMLTLLFLASIVWRSLRNPSWAPGMGETSWIERWQALGRLLPSLSVLFLVLGSIYSGVATPTEAAAVGVVGILGIGIVRRRLTGSAIREGLLDSTQVSCNLFLLLLGGLLLSRFLAQTGLIESGLASIASLGASPQVILILLMLFYLLLGAFLDTFGMILLTLPFVYPLVTSLGYDPVWLGVFLVLMIELSLMTPPIGLNVLVLRQLAPDIPLFQIYRGVIPFVLLTLVLAVVLIYIPSLVLWLPAHLTTR